MNTKTRRSLVLLGKGAVLAAIAGWATQRVRADGGGLRQLAASLDVRFALAAVVIALPAAPVMRTASRRSSATSPSSR